jgi:hypothetical protein
MEVHFDHDTFGYGLVTTLLAGTLKRGGLLDGLLVVPLNR